MLHAFPVPQADIASTVARRHQDRVFALQGLSLLWAVGQLPRVHPVLLGSIACSAVQVRRAMGHVLQARIRSRAQAWLRVVNHVLLVDIASLERLLSQDRASALLERTLKRALG
jgi:hypothetical protein